MARRHGQTTYFIEGEGFVGEQEIRSSNDPSVAALKADVEPAASMDQSRAFRFSRLFDLEPFRPEPEALIELGLAMEDNPNLKDNPDIVAGFTYLGQFVDHDITFDKTEGLPAGQLNPEEIQQGRSPSLDLDSVYGRGAALETKKIYEDNKIRLRVGKTTPSDFGENTKFEIFNDLPRGDNAEKPLEATLGDPRNDENLAVAQTHLAFLKLHNIVVERFAQYGLQGGDLFRTARRSVTRHYQWIVLHDFLPKIIDPAVLNDVLINGRKFFKITSQKEPTMPIEFSVAAYRLGHSMIRDSYEWNRVFQSEGPGPIASLDLLFQFTGSNGSLGGNPTLPTNWVIDWTRFFDFKTVPGFSANPKLNQARSIDTALTTLLKVLPNIPAGPEAALAVRNLLRGRLLGLPTGQAIAEAIGEAALTPEQVIQGPHAEILKRHGFDTQTPLWYYILKEAEVLGNSLRLGPVGSRIVAETFVGLIEGSQTSIVRNRYWRPDLPSLRPGHFTMVDLLLLVNDINPLG
jgi:Animal haem peroxidase